MSHVQWGLAEGPLVCMIVAMQGGLPLGDTLAESWEGRVRHACRDVSIHLRGSQDLNRSPGSHDWKWNMQGDAAMLDQPNKHSAHLVPYIGYPL